MLLQPHHLQYPVEWQGAWVVAAEHVDCLADGQVRLQPGTLQDDAGALLQRHFIPSRVEAQHAHVAAGARPVPLEDLHGRRLARAVRPQQREHLAPFDAQVDAAHGLKLAVLFPQPPRLDDCFAHAAILGEDERTGWLGR